MDYSEIESWKTKDLRNEMEYFKLPVKRSRADMIRAILEAKDASYIRGEQLGDAGKDAVTYNVNKKFALKQYKPRKSSAMITKEANLQRRLAEVRVCPKVIDVDTERKYILMEKLDKHLFDVNSDKSISPEHQKQLVKLYDQMDKARIFHGDANPLNYMTKGKKLYVIDFGMSKEITPKLVKQLGTDRPNRHIMTLGMILKMKAMNFPTSSYSYLVTALKPEQRESFGL
jgi:tRNA A-37 threonylcarbamoyl transferase component Bud32